MQQAEAEVLARIAGEQTGLAARCEQAADGAWHILLLDGWHTHAFPDAHSYRVWHDQRTGTAPARPRPRSRFSRWFRRRSRLPEEYIPDESISISSLDAWSGGPNPREGGLLDRSLENREELRDYGYRQTHRSDRD